MKNLLIIQKLKEVDLKFITESLSGLYNIHRLDEPYNDSCQRKEMILSSSVWLGSVVDKEMYELMDNLDILQLISTGVESLQLDVLKDKNVTVCKSHSHSKYVAEYGVALLHSLAKKIHLHDRLMRDGIWWRPRGEINDNLYMSTTVIRKTIGFVGFGHVSQYMKKMLAGYDCEFLAYDPNPHEFIEDTFLGAQFVDLRELISSADYVVVAAPLIDGTRGMLNKEVLSFAKKDSLWILLSRGQVFIEEDLYHMLEERKIGGIAIDNWFGPPYKDGDKVFPSSDYKYQHMDNVLMSPYRAMYITGHSPNLDDAVENLIRYSQGLPLRYIVDYHYGY